MTATSHAITGALIGAVVANPVLSLPLAFVSHFALDAIPHSGFEHIDTSQKRRKLFHRFLYLDALLLSLFLLFLFANSAGFIIFLCVFLAGSPDFVWAYRYIIQEKIGKNKPKPMNKFNQFHAGIQKQSMKYLVIEIPFTLVVLFLLFTEL